MSNKTKTNFISASVKKVLSLSLLVTGGVVMSSMALALLLQDTASSNNEKVQVWGIQSRVQYLTGMTLSWANSDRVKFEYKEDTNALNFNGAMNLHALVIGSTNQGATGSTVIGGNNNIVKWNWQNAAIIGGNKNTVTNTTTSIIAGATGSNITNVQDSAIFSAEGTIIGSDNTTDTMFIVWGKGHVARGRNTNFIAGSENIQTDQNAQNNVLIGKNIRSNQSNIFVWSNGNTELAPQKGSAFYVNSTSGFGLNTNNPQAALDIANGGLAFNKVYQLSEISDVNVAGVHTVVQKDGKQGVCGYNGSTWVPLTLNAEREGLCTASTQSTPPKHATSTISGAVQFSGQPVVTNGTTLLHQVWSGGMNNNHGGWLNHPWTYKHTGPLDNGDYRCGIGFHMGNPTPDGMKNTDCKACSPITNQRDWRSNGKNDDCDFSCKAGFKKVGRTCTACEVGTYTTDGTVANSCASCTNKPANAHYTTNGINANACQWACDAGYYNVGWACKKAIWQKTDTYTCNVAGGVWKDDKIVTTYHCALEENRGVSVPEHICNHWWAKPATTTVVKWDVNCNPPQWETNWSCPTPNCNISRIAGKCGGATEAVTCIQHKRDRAWNSYETRTQSQQKACTRVCETALCGGANGVATKYQPTALCAAGTASAVGGNASVWSWTCTQLDGAKNCSATRIPLQAGVCGSAHNIMHMSLAAGSANLCGYGSVIGFNENAALYSNRWSWKCRGDNWAHNQEVNCIAHKPVPQAGRCAQAANTCTVGTLKDPVPIPNGRKWSCQGLYGGTTDTNCSLCDPGYHNMGWVCKKAVWQWTDAYTCNTASGKWKDDNVVTTYHCALEENRAIAAPEHICNHWRAKPATTTVVKWEASCNTPQWETNWNCPTPNCNISRIAGKCGGVTEGVTCTQHKKDRAGTIHETRTQVQQKACTRACETAACGSANGVATKYQPTALCAAGTASAVGGNASVRSWTCTQLDGAKNCSANRLPLQAGSCGSSHNINHSALNASSANLCNYGAVINFNENTAIYANRWSWKCRGDNGAYNQDANCIAHKPAPQAGQCAQALNTCTVGTVKDATNIANGKRWSCEGLHGWSTDTTCSLCDNGYVYNSATNRCDPKCGAGYTLHNGVCVKWKCESAPVPRPPVPRPPQSSAGRCVGTYSEGWKCYFIDYGNTKTDASEFALDVNDNCLYASTEDLCRGITRFRRNDESIEQRRWAAAGHYELVQWVWESFDEHSDWNPICNYYGFYHGAPSWANCKGAVTREHFCYWWPNTEKKSCSSLTQTECGKQSWCTRTSWASSSPVPPRPSPGTGKKIWWVKSADSEMPRGFMSLFSVSAWLSREWPQWPRWSQWSQWAYWSQWPRWPQWPSEASEETEGPLGHESPKAHESPEAPEEMPEWPKVHTTQRYQLPPVPHRPQPLPPWLNKIAKCIDDKWNVHPDAYCANAGAKPVCDAEWACALPTVTWSHGCINATTKDHTSQCRTDLSLNNAISCNDAIEVKKYCLPMRRRDCANDEYWFNGGSEWVIDDIMTGGFEKTLKWDPYIRKYKSSLPGEDAFWYEIVGACSRGEPKASASCKSISWKYDKYCSNLTDQWSCDMVNVYQKREDSSWPITIWIFKHSGQCSVSTYDFDNWEEQYDPVCPWIHQKSFKYMDSCEWGVRKEVVCQSKSSNAILNDSECNESEKPDYNMICWWRSSKSTPPTPPTPPASSSEDTSWLYRATSYSWSIHCIEWSSMYIGVCNQNDWIFMGDSISVSKWILWDHLGIYSPRPDKKIWIKDGFAYWDKDKTQPVEVWVYKLTQYWISGDEVPYRYFTVSGGYGPWYQLWRGRIVETLK